MHTFILLLNLICLIELVNILFLEITCFLNNIMTIFLTLYK